MDRLSVPPEPQRPPGVGVQAPVVYVEPTWEHKHLVRDLAKEPAPDEAEFNAFGSKGWELAGAFALGTEAHFYFKRQTS
jgi:hypothetical protein